MSIDNFLNDKEVVSYVTRAEHIKKSKKEFSDIIDDNGNQYVDLVQEGGGVLGIALVGYTYIMEKAGIRFLSLAGTSAGAINTMLIATIDKAENEKSEKILKYISKQKFSDFMDGKSFIKKLITKLIQKKSVLWFAIFRIFKIIRVLKKRLGLNPGNHFKSWIENILKENGNINTIEDLSKFRNELPNLTHRHSKNISDIKAKTTIITSDITTCSKIEFPRMAELYWKNYQKTSLASLVRASMSIPYFFEPFEVSNIPNSGNTNDEKWKKFASYYGSVPQKVKFVDGGMLSNFPINIFHREDGKEPRMPTFGVRLSTYRKEVKNTDSIFSMSGAMISTMRQIHDYDFILKNPDYRKLICNIDADKEFNWLDFNISEKDSVKLFALGAKKAIEFLEDDEKFNWNEYKQSRQN